MIFYSKSAAGFFDDNIHAPEQIPPDAVSVAADRHAALLAAQAQGQVIAADKGGAPVCADAPPPSAGVVWRRLQDAAQAALHASDRVVLRCLEAGRPVPAAWSSYRVALRAIVATASGEPDAALPARPPFPSAT